MWSRVARAHRARLLRAVFIYIVFYALVLGHLAAFDGGVSQLITLHTYILYACIGLLNSIFNLSALLRQT